MQARWRRSGLAILCYGAACLLAASCGSSGTKAGGEAAPITLRMGTNDGPGRPSSKAIEEFARHVQALSGGRLRIAPVWQSAGPQNAQWDQMVARQVAGGTLDLAMVPSRAWDTEHVTSLRALQAPFLVTSDAHLDRVVTAPVARDLLAGLTGRGVVGLALVPEGLRHPFAFAAPLLGAADYAGAAIRTPYSTLSYGLIEALGARPVDLIGPNLDLAVEGSSVVAAESEFALASSLPTPNVATGNVTFFPKADTLVVNAKTFAGLDEEQRDVLRRAAERTTRWAIDTRQTDVAAAAAYCAQGGAVVLASADELAELLEAAAPVAAELQRDPGTAAAIAAIQALRPDVTVGVRACGTTARRSAAFVAADEPTPIDGVYRAQLDQQELVDRGMAPQDAFDNRGLITLTFDRGALVIREERGLWPDCHGLYRVDGEEVQVLITGPGCPKEERPMRTRWTIASGALQLTMIDPTDAFTRVWWGGEPFKKVAAGERQPAAIPDGSYRRTISEQELLDGHVLPGEARREAGVYTLALDHGHFGLVTANDFDLPDCHGATTLDDGRVSFVLTDCGGGLLLSARVSFAGDQLRFDGVEAGKAVVVAVFGGAPWGRLH